ncbi:MAG: Fatty acid-binding protein DegV, partial [Chloroflexi bacterium]
MNTPKVGIIIDSAASIPSDVPFLRPSVVPLSIIIDETAYLDQIDISTSDIYKKLKSGSHSFSTSAPSPAQFYKAIVSVSSKFESILVITVSPKFSGTINSAKVAIDTYLEEQTNPIDIRLFDSGSAAGGEGLIVMEACKAAMHSDSIDEVERYAKAASEQVRLLAYVDTLYYLWKGGRVPGIAYLGANMLGLKPLFEMRQGKIIRHGVHRSELDAIDSMTVLISDNVTGNDIKACVMHADALEQANQIVESLNASTLVVDQYITELTPAMGVHTGPGTVGVAF